MEMGKHFIVMEIPIKVNDLKEKNRELELIFIITFKHSIMAIDIMMKKMDLES